MNTFNKYVLRRLYNIDHSGRGEQGTVRRKELKITVRPITFLALRNLIEVGPGQYGSSVMELSLRFMLAAMGAISDEEMTKVCIEMTVAITDHAALTANLVRMAQEIGEITTKSVD